MPYKSKSRNCMKNIQKLVDEEDNIISITDFSRGDTVMVVLKDSFDEELIFYYPTVYQVRLISSEK